MTENGRRRRGAVLEGAILDAAWEELAETGWGGFTVEGVARRCGTSKAVIYRRWVNRVHLAHGMLHRAISEAPVPFELEGDIRADLLSHLRTVASFLNSPFGAAVRGVVCDELPSDIGSALTGATESAVSQIVDAALERGDLTRRPTALVLNVGHALMMAEFVQTGSPPWDDVLIAIVEEVWLPALQSTQSGS